MRSTLSLFLVAAGLSACGTPDAVIPEDTTVIPDAPTRVTQGLQAEYRFDEGSGSVVHDSSGQSGPADLNIESAAKVTWGDGSLSINQGTILRTALQPDRIRLAINLSQEMTFEAWMVAKELDQGGPATILSYGVSEEESNMRVTQVGPTYQFQVRSLEVLEEIVEGQEPKLYFTQVAMRPSSVPGTLSHVVVTRTKTGVTRIYVDGALTQEERTEGATGAWYLGSELALANTLRDLDRPWLGTLHHVAIYDHALTEPEISQNYGMGP